MIAVFSATLLFRAASANDSEKELKAQAEALLAKSHDLSNIEAPGSPAFTLMATIHYQIGTQTADGDGQVVWLAPGHYQETFSAPGYAYKEIAQDGKLYLSRTDNQMPLLMYELNRIILTAMDSGKALDGKVKEAKTASSAAGQAITCAKMKPRGLSLTACLDNDGDIATIESNWPSGVSALDAVYEFSGFVGFGTKRFPQKLVFRGGDGHTIEIAIGSISSATDTSQEFRPPVGSVVEDWCAEPKIEADASHAATLPWVPLTPLSGIRASLYVVVGPGGRARSVTLIHTTQTISDKDIQTWIGTARFPVHSCGDAGLEYQMELSMQMGLPQ